MLIHPNYEHSEISAMSTDSSVDALVVVTLGVPILYLLMLFFRGFMKGYRGSERPALKPNSLQDDNQLAGVVMNNRTADSRSRSAVNQNDNGSLLKINTAQPKIFVSYRREDSADAVGRIYDWLLQRFGEGTVFKDVDSIPLGVDFRKSIDQAVSNATVLLVIIGRTWLSVSGSKNERKIDSPSDFVRIEIATALRRGIPTIPLLISGANMPDTEALPEEIRELRFRNAVAIRPDPDFGNDMDRLIRGIVKLHASHSVDPTAIVH